MESGLLSETLSVILDIVPVAALVFLGISFLRGRHRYREEERSLRDAIDQFRETEQAEGKEGHRE